MDDASRRNERIRVAPPTMQSCGYNPFGSGMMYTNSRVTKKRALRRSAESLQIQGCELREAKASLLRLYAQEKAALASPSSGVNPDLKRICACRARAERRYVTCLIRYLRNSNRMDAIEANKLQKKFTRKYTATTGTSNMEYLLGMYPCELD